MSRNVGSLRRKRGLLVRKSLCVRVARRVVLRRSNCCYVASKRLRTMVVGVGASGVGGRRTALQRRSGGGGGERSWFVSNWRRGQWHHLALRHCHVVSGAGQNNEIVRGSVVNGSRRTGVVIYEDVTGRGGCRAQKDDRDCLVLRVLQDPGLQPLGDPLDGHALSGFVDFQAKRRALSLCVVPAAPYPLLSHSLNKRKLLFYFILKSKSNPFTRSWAR